MALDPRLIRECVIAIAHRASVKHMERAEREIQRVLVRMLNAGKIKTHRELHSAIYAVLLTSSDLDRHEVLPLFDVDLLTRAQLATWALSFALEMARQTTGTIGGTNIANKFAEEPWARIARSFMDKKVVGAATMDGILDGIAGDVEGKIMPGFQKSYEQAYAKSFTMVREANEKILQRAQEVIARGLGNKFVPGSDVETTPNKADIRLDMEDLYKSLGLRPQDPAYVSLVVNNNLNRAWQEGKDTVSHNEDGRPKDWVWGYEWTHGGSREPRPTHLAMNGHTAKKDDAIWETFTSPPIAHNCSCSRSAISTYEAEEKGYISKPAPTLSKTALEKAGFKPHEVEQLVDKPVNEAIHHDLLKADRFPRSTFNLKSGNRAIINPTGVSGQAGLSSEALAALHPLSKGGKTAAQMLNKGLLDNLESQLAKPNLTAEQKKFLNAHLELALTAKKEIDKEAIAIAKASAQAERLRTLELAESSIISRRTEKAFVVDDYGRILLEKEGLEREVGFTRAEAGLMKDATLTHNHPSGHSFSWEDINHAIKADMKEIRAIGTNTLGETHLHVLQRPKAGWPSTSRTKQLHADLNDAVRLEFKSAISSGTVSVDEATAAHWHEVNSRLASRLNIRYDRVRRKG
jgi:hypothetical protein